MTTPSMDDSPAGGRLARRAARRRRRQRLALIAAVALAVGAVLLATLPRLAGERPGTGDGGAASGEGDGREQHTLLLVRIPDEPGAALGVTLLAAGPDADDGAVLFLPVGTLIDIPGYGLDRLGASYQYGGAPLIEAAVENALAVRVDNTALVTDAALGAWLDRLGAIEVDVPERLVRRDDDGEPSLRFAAGPQHLDGARLVEYLAFRERASDELDTFARQERVWEAVLDRVAAGPDADEADAGEVGGDDGARLLGAGPQLDTAARPGWLTALFTGLGRARAAGTLRQALLPVEPFGGQGPDGGMTYRLREDEAKALVRELLAASTAEREDREPLRVEVLNGVGVPGIGQAVHRKLEGGGFRIVRTDNARSFAFEQTRILVYDEARLPDARRLRSLLGVGSISVSRTPQSVVDLTIVVGADFLSATEGREP